MKRILLGVALLVRAGAVFADPFPFPTHWQKIIECDHGAVVVDVNTYERRMFQAVVRNREINRHLFGYPKDEVVIQGVAHQGVFHPGDFRGFAREGGTYCQHSGSAPSIRVFREGTGLKLVLHQHGAECCSEYNSYGECVGNAWVIPKKDLADWHFRDCRILN